MKKNCRYCSHTRLKVVLSTRWRYKIWLDITRNKELYLTLSRILARSEKKVMVIISTGKTIILTEYANGTIFLRWCTVIADANMLYKSIGSVNCYIDAHLILTRWVANLVGSEYFF